MEEMARTRESELPQYATVMKNLSPFLAPSNSQIYATNPNLHTPNPQTTLTHSRRVHEFSHYTHAMVAPSPTYSRYIFNVLGMATPPQAPQTTLPNSHQALHQNPQQNLYPRSMGFQNPNSFFESYYSQFGKESSFNPQDSWKSDEINIRES